MMADAVYGMFGLTKAEIEKRGGVSLMPDEAHRLINALAPSDFRIEYRDDAFGQFPQALIRVNGQWRRVLREDLARQVCTGSSALVTLPAILASIVYGVRLEGDAFVVVDSLTDG